MPGSGDHIDSRAGLSRRWCPVAVAALVALPATPSMGASPECRAPEPVCNARDGVFAVSSAFDPYSSAVRIGADLLVTNRHVVADEARLRIRLKDGREIEGEVVPNSRGWDLILVKAELPDGPILELGSDVTGDLYAVGQDINHRAIKVFPKGRTLKAPGEDLPSGRLHHTAHTQPGVSGGALVNAEGKVVAIATSGGSGHFEAIPASRIETLKSASGPEHAERSAEIGKAYRECTVDLEKAHRANDALPNDVAVRIEQACTATENRQMYDLAGQALARARRIEAALSFFERSVAADPNAVNARIGYVITLMYARKHQDALDHVRWLLATVPESAEAQRFAIHVGKQSGDMELARRGLALVEKHNPAQFEAAKRFLETPAPGQRKLR